jgi:predicted permease
VTQALTVLGIVAPVFALVAVGWAWARAGRPFDTAFVTQIAMTLAVPALIFTALARTELAPADLGRMTAASLAAYGAALALFWALRPLLAARAGLGRRSFVAPMAFGNTGNLGLPLAVFAFGEAGLGYAVVAFAVTSVLTFTVGVWCFAGVGRPGRVLREPMVLASLAGAAVLWGGWPLPGVLLDATALLGQMAIPLMLVTLGVAVARLSAGGLGRALLLALLKAGACAGLGLLAARAFGLGEVAGGVLILQMAMPVAVTSYLLAERFDADAPAVAGLVMASTALSVIVLPLLLALLV